MRARLEALELAPLSAAAGGEGRRPRLVYGTILAGDQFIHCEATRERLHREFQAQAVAMEGAALAQVAERLGVPWLEIRALSDLAGADSRFDFAKFVEEVAQSSALILQAPPAGALTRLASRPDGSGDEPKPAGGRAWPETRGRPSAAPQPISMQYVPMTMSTVPAVIPRRRSAW